MRKSEGSPKLETRKTVLFFSLSIHHSVYPVSGTYSKLRINPGRTFAANPDKTFVTNRSNGFLGFPKRKTRQSGPNPPWNPVGKHPQQFGRFLLCGTRLFPENSLANLRRQRLRGHTADQNPFSGRTRAHCVPVEPD